MFVVSAASSDSSAVSKSDVINAAVQGASAVLRRIGFKNISVLVKGQELQAPDRHGYYWDDLQKEFVRNPLLK